MDIHGSKQAQYAWSSVIERGVYRKKPQLRSWGFYMKLGNTLRTIESSQVVDGICVTGEDKEIVKSHQSYGRRAYTRYTLTATEGKRHW